MKIGLLADIHGDADNLRKAIAQLRRRQVDKFVVLGDLIFSGHHATETVGLLQDCGATGVWGNHELGLCVDPDDEIREICPEPALAYFRGLQTHYTLNEVLFTHTLPTEDPTNPLSYYLGLNPLSDGALQTCFERFEHRIMMIGHFHCWFAANQAGPIAWDGVQPLSLTPPDRYFLVIHAVMFGWTAVFDECTNVLTPIRL